MRQWFLRGLRPDRQLVKIRPAKCDVVALLKTELNWNAKDDEAAQLDGRSFLHYAVHARELARASVLNHGSLT